MPHSRRHAGQKAYWGTGRLDIALASQAPRRRILVKQIAVEDSRSVLWHVRKRVLKLEARTGLPRAPSEQRRETSPKRNEGDLLREAPLEP